VKCDVCRLQRYIGTLHPGACGIFDSAMDSELYASKTLSLIAGEAQNSRNHQVANTTY